jgi:hypothetical protein
LRRSVFNTAAAAGIGFAATGLAAAGWLGALPEAARVITVCVGVILAPAAVTLAIVSARVSVPSFLLAHCCRSSACFARDCGGGGVARRASTLRLHGRDGVMLLVAYPR